MIYTKLKIYTLIYFVWYMGSPQGGAAVVGRKNKKYIKLNIFSLIYFWSLFLLFCVLSFANLNAANVEERDFFASLRANETNVRAGPGPNYPIKFTFKMRGIPVKVITEYDNWYEIKDFDGDTGWVNQNLLTKRRMIIVKTGKSFVNIYSNFTEKSKNILRLQNNVVAEFIRCKASWCAIKTAGKKGWIERKEIWGIDEND